MPPVRILANMNISPLTVSALREVGWDIIRVSQVLPSNASDREILEFARSQERIVVTQDLDFSSLIALGGFDKPSLVTIRLSTSDPEAVTQRLLIILPEIQEQLHQGCAITVEDSSFRVRRLPVQ